MPDGALPDTPARLRHLARLAAAHSIGDQSALAAELQAAYDVGLSWDACYEALLQLVAYTGYPRTLNALATYRAVTGLAPAERPSEEWVTHARAVWPERGAAIFRRLWPGHELADNVRPVSAELAEWVINELERETPAFRHEEDRHGGSSALLFRLTLLFACLHRM